MGLGVYSQSLKLIIPGPDNSPSCKETGGTGFPACAKNTLLSQAIYLFIFPN
jgi:hypothetical protein